MTMNLGRGMGPVMMDLVNVEFIGELYLQKMVGDEEVPAPNPNHSSSHLKGNVRLPGKENSNPHGARPVHQLITMIKWIRTSRVSVKNSLSSSQAP